MGGQGEGDASLRGRLFAHGMFIQWGGVIRGRCKFKGVCCLIIAIKIMVVFFLTIP